MCCPQLYSDLIFQPAFAAFGTSSAISYPSRGLVPKGQSKAGHNVPFNWMIRQESYHVVLPAVLCPRTGYDRCINGQLIVRSPQTEYDLAIALSWNFAQSEYRTNTRACGLACALPDSQITCARHGILVTKCTPTCSESWCAVCCLLRNSFPSPP